MRIERLGDLGSAPAVLRVITDGAARRDLPPPAALIGDWFDSGAVIAPSAGVISGIDARTGAPFVNQLFLAMSGGAASPTGDAWWTIGHVGNAGLCCIDGVELTELTQPVVVHRRGFLADSEGAGTFTGAPSTIAEFGPVGGAIDIGYLSDGHVHPPRGVRGGSDGGRADQHLVAPDGSTSQLPACAQVSIKAGERIVAVSCGGGGYGPPTARAPDRVADAVRDGLLSRARARDVYGVALDAEGAVIADETRRIREARA